MLVQEWQACAACGGSGRTMKWCEHCGSALDVGPCAACGGAGGRTALVFCPRTTAVPMVWPWTLPAVGSEIPLMPNFTPLCPPVWRPAPLRGAGG
jgi:hypothetical protein